MDATRPVALPPGARGIPETVLTRRLPAALYKQWGIEVTQEWFAVGGYYYPVNELGNLRTARGPRHPFTTRAVLVTTVFFLGLVLSGDVVDFLERQLACQHDAVKAQTRQSDCTSAIVHRHLRAAVHFELRKKMTNGAIDAEVLQDDGVNADVLKRGQGIDQFIEFVERQGRAIWQAGA